MGGLEDKKNISLKNIKTLLTGLNTELGLNLTIKDKKLKVDKTLAVIYELYPNLITDELENLIRDQLFIRINEGLGLPFENHRLMNDNGTITIRDIGTVYNGDANVITSVQNAEANKDGVRYETVLIDLNNPANWKISTGTISPLKKYTTLKGIETWANNEVEARLNALYYKVINYLFQTLNGYEWSDDEIIYDDSTDTNTNGEKALNTYRAIQEVINKIGAKDGIRGFNQADENHEGEDTFLNKVDKNKITIIIDAATLSNIQTYLRTYTSYKDIADSVNPWYTGKIESYNFDQQGITDCIAYVLSPAALAYGIVNENGNTIFGTAQQVLESNHFNYGAAMLKQAAKAKIIAGVAPEPTPEQIQATNEKKAVAEKKAKAKKEAKAKEVKKAADKLKAAEEAKAAESATDENKNNEVSEKSE